MLVRALIDRQGQVVGICADPDDVPVTETAVDTTPARPGDRIQEIRIPEHLPLLELHRRLTYDHTTGQLRLAAPTTPPHLVA